MHSAIFLSIGICPKSALEKFYINWMLMATSAHFYCWAILPKTTDCGFISDHRRVCISFATISSLYGMVKGYLTHLKASFILSRWRLIKAMAMCVQNWNFCNGITNYLLASKGGTTYILNAYEHLNDGTVLMRKAANWGEWERGAQHTHTQGRSTHTQGGQ